MNVQKEVTLNALVKRINRKLAPQCQVMRKSRGAYSSDIGDFYVVDTSYNSFAATHVDVWDYAQELGCVGHREVLAQEG